MTNWVWKSVDCNPEISCLGSRSSAFVLDISGRYVLFINNGTITCLLLISNCENRFNVDETKTIQAKHCVRTITGNSNCILMLDVTGTLFYLQGSGNAPKVLNSSNADELFDSSASVSWYEVKQLKHCLAMTGVTDSVAFLYYEQFLYSALIHTDEIEKGYSEFSKARLHYFDPGKTHFLAVLKGGIVDTVCIKILGSFTSERAILVIVEPSHINFSMPTDSGQIVSQPYAIDLQDETIVSVMEFNKKCCIMIACKSGKILCLKFNTNSKTFQISKIWLPTEVIAIIGHEGDEIILLYSDLNNLHMCTVNDSDELTFLKVSLNVRGIKHFIKADNRILAITTNCCIYEGGIDEIEDHEEVELTSDQLLSRIYEVGKTVERLNKEIQVKGDLIQALEISQIPDIGRNVHVIIKKSELVLENKTEYVLKKELWSLKIDVKDLPTNYIEMRVLQNDIPPGHNESFHWNGTNPAKVRAVLVCDAKDSVIFIDLEVSSEESTSWIEDTWLDDIKKFLEEDCNFKH